MKLKKLFALALCFAMCAVTLCVSVNAEETSYKGLVLNKTAAVNDHGTYTITLESYLETVPTDIVLVVDQSSSMGNDYAQEDGEWVYTKSSGSPKFSIGIFWDNTTYYVQDPYDPEVYHELNPYFSGFYNIIYFIKYSYTDSQGGTHTVEAGWNQPQYYTRTWSGGDAIKKIDAAKSKAAELVTGVKTAAQSSGLDHRIAVVGFGVGEEYQGQSFNYSNTGLFNGGSFTTYNSLQESHYQAAFKSVLTQETAITASIGALSASDNMASLHEYGLEIASTLYAKNDNETRNKVVVVITDGAPGWTGYEKARADAAISKAGTLKGQDATIFTINMDEEANVSGTDNMNVSLRNISSSQCYYAATILEDFDTAIAAVQTKLLATGLELDRNTQIIDNLSAYFDFEGTVASENIRLYTAECTGKSNGKYTFGQRVQVIGDALSAYTVTLTPETKTLTVKGFSFEACSGVSSENCAGEKLYVEIDVITVPGFLGGNGVPTNLNTSGVYDTGLFLAFPVPEVDVPLNYSIAGDQEVTLYNGNEINLNALFTPDSVGGIYNDFVKVEYTLSDQNGVIGNSTIVPDATLDAESLFADLKEQKPSACNTYTLSCVVTPTKDGTYQPKSDITAASEIHVLVPTVTGTDVTIWQGNSTKLAATTSWACTCADAKTGDNPTGTTTVFAEQDPIVTLTDLNVTPADCKKYKVTYTANGISYDDEFWVHVLTASITVDDTKIYLSESVTVDDVKKLDHYSWETSCGHDNVPEMTDTEKSAQKTPEPSFATVTPTNCGEHKAYLKIGTITYTTSDTFTIHVLKPTVETLGTTIFLGDDARLTGSVDSWACDRQVCENIQSGSKNADIEDDITWEFVKVDDNKVTTDKVTDEKLTKCTPTVAIGTLYGQKFTSETVMVHVVLPTVTGAEATIKMGNPAPLAATTEWGNDKCEGDHVEAPAKPSFALGSKFYDTDGTTEVTNAGVLDGNPSYPSSCHTYIAAALVNGVEYTFDGNRDDFMIHVQTPVVTGTDTAIYLGNDTTLAAEITDWNACKPAEGEKNGTHGQGLTNSNEANPEHSFIYTDNETNTQVTTVSPVTCKPYTVGLKTIGGVTLAGTEYPDEFTVHVHVPQFTVTAQDLWADYNASVHLYNDTDSDAVVSIAQIWVDRRGDDSTLIATGNDVVDITDLVFHKIDDTVMTNPYTMVDSDVDVNIIKITADVNGEDYAAVKADSTEDTDKQLSVTKAKSEEDHDFTVHVNKFKAVITNNGTQNAIYTLSNGTKVAVEAGKSTTVAGLICGKDYEISEANNDWTWRYGEAASAKDADGNEKKYISCKVNEVKASDTPESSDRVFMTYGNITNPKWLADEDCVINNAATRDCTIPERKEDGEEVTNE